MTVNSFDPRRISAGNSVTKIFDAPYVTAADDLEIILVNATTGAEVLQTLNTHYAVTDIGNQSGSTVTMVTAPPTGYLLDRRRNPFQTQTTHFIEGEEEPASSKEATLDRIVMMVQALTLIAQVVNANTVHVPYGELSVTIPSVSLRKGKALSFDPVTGDPTVTTLRVAQFYFLNGNPSNADGADNDVTLNMVSGDVFLKVAGVWTVQGNLRGATGVRGSVWFTGAAAPGVIVGVLDGDNYLQTGGAGAGDYYKRVAGAWVFQINLKGPSGPGTGDVTGPAGATADTFALFSGVTGKLIKAHTGGPGGLAVKSSVAGATEIDVGSITYDRLIAAAIGTAAEINSGAASKLVSVAAGRTSMAPQTPAYAASQVLDLSTGCEFDITLTGAVNLAAPINAYIGQPVVIWLTQDATGGRAITASTTNWKLGSFTPSIVANKTDMIKGVVKSLAPTVIHGSYQPGTA